MAAFLASFSSRGGVEDQGETLRAAVLSGAAAQVVVGGVGHVALLLVQDEDSRKGPDATGRSDMNRRFHGTRRLL